MVQSPISTLPPEVLHQVLKYLPIITLLRYARTSQRNYSAAILALQELRLAILTRKMHGTLVFLSSSTFEDFDSDFGDFGTSVFDNFGRNQITIISPLEPSSNRPLRFKTTSSKVPPLTPAQHREKLFQLHNADACSILSTPTLANLSSLTLHLYHIISPSLTEILATLLPNLRDLRLNFSHKHIHDPCLPAHYWTSPVHLQQSPIWNSLAGLGKESSAKLRLKKLKKLTLERAGITNFQLRKWIECNPDLRELRLRNVAGVDNEFVQWLGGYYATDRIGGCRSEMPRPARLEILALESCAALSIDSVQELGWLDSLIGEGTQDQDGSSALHVLSFRFSASVTTLALVEYLESRHPTVQQITLPDERTLVPKSKKRRFSQLSTRRVEQDNRRNGGNETGNIDVGIQALSVSDSETDDDSSGSDKSASSSPVSYMRVINGLKLRKAYTPEDVIEPDPNAI